jgi:hypothetical protein
MATRGGDEMLGVVHDSRIALTKGRFVTKTIYNTIPSVPIFYFMAANDTNGLRYYWVNPDATMLNSPTPAGGASYVAASLVVEGRIILGNFVVP